MGYKLRIGSLRRRAIAFSQVSALGAITLSCLAKNDTYFWAVLYGQIKARVISVK